MRAFAVAAALATCALAPAAVRAQPVSERSGPDTYLRLHAGAVVPQASDLDALDTGYGLGAAVGARFDRHVSVEGGVGWQRATGTSGGVRQTFSDVPLDAILRLRLPAGRAELAALGGVTLHVLDLSTEVAGQTSSHGATAFGALVGAAAGLELSPTMVFGAEVRRTFARAKPAGVSTHVDVVTIDLTLEYRF